MGLGREYAPALGASVAKVVVNDYSGTHLDGKPGDSARAQSVVDEIRTAGATAIADSHDVSKDPKKVIATVVDSYGTVEILIYNAGIFGKTSSHDDVDNEDFMRVLEIGVLGTTLITSTAYAIMRKKKIW